MVKKVMFTLNLFSVPSTKLKALIAYINVPHNHNRNQLVI